MNKNTKTTMMKQLILILLLLIVMSACNSSTQSDQPAVSDTQNEQLEVPTENETAQNEPTASAKSDTQDDEPVAPAESNIQDEQETVSTENDTQDEPEAGLSEIDSEIQAAMDSLTTADTPPGMVVWIDAPAYRFEGASGFANRTDATAMPPEGAFRIGSITKMFTAAVIMQLAEDSTLTLDDSLAMWLPDVADQLPYGDQITIRQLLTHTSGLFNVVEHEAYFADLFTEMVVDEETGNVTLDCVERDPHDTLARYVYGKEAQFEPGAEWRYSNTNYTLLGMIIETAVKTPLAEAYRTNIYEPLGMTSTFLDCYEEPVIETVHGYSGVGDDMADVTELHESIGWSAGGLVSTAPDLITFARGLFGGALFNNPESLTTMTTPAPGAAYGMGISLQEAYMGHAGYITGFRSVLNYAPEYDAVVVILYNNDATDPEQSVADMMTPATPLLGVE